MMRLIVLVAALAATPALADVEITFREGAPKDRFVLRNVADCALRNAEIAIDLNGSAGKLIFDTSASGAGVEVFQPFEIVRGRDALAAVPDVTDGDRAVSFVITELPAGAEVVVTTDVDDTRGAREITVAGSELAGATAALSASDHRSSATYTDRPALLVETPPCAD